MLTKSQQVAIDEIKEFIKNDMIVHCLSGSPGTGKSYLIETEIPKLLRNTPYFLVTTATTNKAAAVIHGVTLCKAFGISLKADMDTGVQDYNLSRLKTMHNQFIIIDEASMLDGKLWQIVQESSINCKFLLVGDKYQLPPVKSTFNPFNEYPISELTEVVRQKDPDFLDEIKHAKQGVIESEVYIPKENSCIHYLKTNKEVRDLLASFTTNDKALAYTNDKSVDLAFTIRRLQNKSTDFCIGDPVAPKNYCEDIQGYSVQTGEDLIVSAIGKKQNIKIDTYDIEVRPFNFVGTNGTFLVPSNYKYALVVAKEMAKKKKWREYYKIKEGLLDLRFNEASTIHCSQGSTYDRVFIHMTDLLTCKSYSTKARLLYVALSRAKNDVYIYEGDR